MLRSFVFVLSIFFVLLGLAFGLESAGAAPCYACATPDCSKLYVASSQTYSIWKSCGSNQCRAKIHASSSANFTVFATDIVGRNSWYNGDKFVSVSTLSSAIPVPCFEAGPELVTLGDVVFVFYCKSSTGCDISYTFDVEPINNCPNPVCPKPSCPKAELTCPTPFFAIGTRVGMFVAVFFLAFVAVIGVFLALAVGFIWGRIPREAKYSEQIEVEMQASTP